ncbi:DUF4890 domain-containing protein [Labilibacter sediminis]|nr:DUF4890 domain-containing protein [Labilibacter sediminis]
MKSLLFGLITVLAFGLSSSVMAQGNKGGTPEERAQKQTEQMKTSLQLDEEQSAKVAELNLKYIKKRNHVRKDNSGDKEGMRAAMSQLNKERNAEFKEVLTEEQYQKFLKREEAMKKKRAQGKGKGMKK